MKEYGVFSVRNQAQKILFDEEMSGQISDGAWENTAPYDHWEVWCSAEVVVDPDNVGRNFYAKKDNYNLNRKDLLDIVGDRMLESVRKVQPDYTWDDMVADLKDLKTIMKIQRSETVEERAVRENKEADDRRQSQEIQAARNATAAEVKQLADELGVDVGYVSTDYVKYNDGIPHKAVLALVEAAVEAATKPKVDHDQLRPGPG